MPILNTFDLQQIRSLANDYFWNTAGDDFGTNEVGEIRNIADLRILAHTLTTHARIGTQTDYITDPSLTFARWGAIQTAFGENLLEILNQAENADRKAAIALACNTDITNLTATNITACIQASEHGILDRTDSQVLYALWNHGINNDFVLSDANVGRADAMMAGATTLFDWSEDSGEMIAGKIVLGGVLMAGMAFGSPAVAGYTSAFITATSVLLFGHGVYAGLQAVQAEQQATDGVTEYLAMRGQGQAVAEIGMAALGAYGGYRGMVKNPLRLPKSGLWPRTPNTPTLAAGLADSAGLIVRNQPTAPTFTLYIAHWISKSKILGPLTAYVDPKTGLLMVLQVRESLVAEYIVVSAELATELLAALRSRQLSIPTGGKYASQLESALCKILGQPLPTPAAAPAASTVPLLSTASGH